MQPSFAHALTLNIPSAIYFNTGSMPIIFNYNKHLDIILSRPLYTLLFAGKGEGRIFVGDVGLRGYEEVNILKKGRNYACGLKEDLACLLGMDCSSIRKILNFLFNACKHQNSYKLILFNK